MLFVNDFENAWGLLHQVQREMLRAASSLEERSTAGTREMVDDGEAFLLTLDLPGVTEGSLDVHFQDEVLSIKASRETAAPEGYARRLTERSAFEFLRNYQVPGRVNGDAVTAKLEQGVLTVRLEKAAEVQSRRIEVAVQ